MRHRALVVHGAVADQVDIPRPAGGDRSSTRSCSSTWSTRSRRASPGGSPRRKRATPALRAMGGLDQRKEEIRDMRRIHWLTDFVDDVRYAIRSLRRTPG